MKKKSGMSSGKGDRSLSLYLEEIGNIPLLTREQENEHARKAAAGNRNSIEIMLKSNLRFVVNTAKRYRNQGFPLEDLIAEGNIGLMNALERYDIDKGYHFISYAVWWIRQAIQKAIYEKSKMIRTPMNRINELIQVEKARTRLGQLNGREAELHEIAAEANMTPEHVSSLIESGQDHVSLDSPLNSEEGSAELHSIIEAKGYRRPDEEVMSKSLSEDINKVLRTLTIKESEILQYRFGLNGRRPHCLSEIGAMYKLTKERIRQIEKKAITRLQHPSRSNYLKAYVS